MAELLEQLRNSLGDSYSIEEELGGGGMARVFLAEEIALRRQVVIKVLPPDVSSAVSMERFKREVLLAARLQHPHIVPLFSVGEVEGMAFYTMPYIEGQSLRARLAKGPLSISEAIVILRDVARALAYAHEKDVAHRDIKPDNILIAGTSAVITDFGVAKALSEASVSGDLTTAGVALGTPAYMAPEQVAADPTIDVRTDIYSFGVTAYELLTGATPFPGVTGRAVMAAHVLETPKPVDEVRWEIPAALAALVMRCLAKDPDDRPQTASAIVAALESIPISGAEPRERTRENGWISRLSWRSALAAAVVVAVIGAVLVWSNRGTVATAATLDSIAVIPFENSSGSTSLNYLEDGIADQVRDVLASIPGITVKARSSSRQMMHADVREIGSKLNVAAVVQGTVNQANGRLRVSAELVRTADEASLWSANFDRTPSELALIQDSIAHAVTERLARPAVAISATAIERAARGTSNPAAYNPHLRGRYEFDHLDFPRAAESFRQAVAVDPKFAKAYGYLAMAYTNATVLGVGSPDSLNALAAATAAKALDLDPNVAEAYAAQAFVLMSRRV
ncbi:MAG TPA: serine/threonine-protein kinase, partial [Gemmatimonadaceae bacterium]|nr:serine/threonine-protein kinase [Gemmatimonadaceae bacterium]